MPERSLMGVARVTLAVPFYGDVGFLESALASIRSQTVADWEALVVDDCAPSPDGRALVERLGDPRIRYVRNPANLGIAANWNRCIELCRTPLVALVHGDDELMPDYVAKMLAAHDLWPDADAIFCGAQVIDERGAPVFSFRDHVKQWLLPDRARAFALKGEAGAAALLRGNFIMCPTLCYKRALFGRIGFSTRWRMVLDMDFYLRALIDGATFVGIADVAYRYRRHGAQATAQYERNLRRFAEETDLWLWASRRAGELGWRDAAAVGRRMTIIKLQLVHSILVDAAGLRFGQAFRKLGRMRQTWHAARFSGL